MKLSWIVAAEELLPERSRRAAARILGLFDGQRDWHPITTAPFNRDIETRVRVAHGVRALPFPCRLTASGWINADLGLHMAINPVEWRPWPARNT